MNKILPIIYSLACAADEDDFKRVAAAEVRTVVPRSFVLAATKETKVVSGQSRESAKRSELQTGKIKTYQR